MLDIVQKKAVVVGGGRIAYRKITSLLKAGAHVTVISPDVHECVKELVDAQRIEWHKKVFQKEDVMNAFIVIAATNDKKINAKVHQNTSSQQLINVVDDKDISNFHVPAKLSRGKLTIAVATEGASPALAKLIRDDLAKVYDETYEDYVNFLAFAREKIHNTKRDHAVKIQWLYEITDVNQYNKVINQQHFLDKIIMKQKNSEVDIVATSSDE